MKEWAASLGATRLDYIHAYLVNEYISGMMFVTAWNLEVGTAHAVPASASCPVPLPRSTSDARVH